MVADEGSCVESVGGNPSPGNVVRRTLTVAMGW